MFVIVYGNWRRKVTAWCVGKLNFVIPFWWLLVLTYGLVYTHKRQFSIFSFFSSSKYLLCVSFFFSFFFEYCYYYPYMMLGYKHSHWISQKQNHIYRLSQVSPCVSSSTKKFFVDRRPSSHSTRTFSLLSIRTQNSLFWFQRKDIYPVSTFET